jgi:hypothetical protein
VPLKYKPYYLELFFRVYVQRVEQVTNIDVNHPRVVQMAKYLLTHDIETYYIHLAGLCIKPDDSSDPAFIQQLKKVKLDLEKQSSDQVSKIEDAKHYKQKQAEKDTLNALSPLNGPRTF